MKTFLSSVGWTPTAVGVRRGTAAAAIELVETLAPDVIVVDLNLPDLGGIELIQRLGLIAPRVSPLVLTMLDDESVFAAVCAGARGYLLKDTPTERIVAAIRAVAAGEAVFSPVSLPACSPSPLTAPAPAQPGCSPS